MAGKTYSLREAAKYLQGKGVDVSELRMRTLVNQHEIFVNDEGTQKAETSGTAIKTWQVSQKALDAYAKAAASGAVRTNTGAKAYKISVTAEQLTELREWAQARGIAEPTRANVAYVKKNKAEANGASEDGAVGSDTIAEAFADETDDLFAEQDA